MPSDRRSASRNRSAAREPPVRSRAGDEGDDDRPEIDEWDLVYWRNQRSVLSRTEAKLFRALLNGFGQVVSHKELITAAWGTDIDAHARQNLTTAVLRLRKRLLRLGLGIETVRGRGYIFEPLITPVSHSRRRPRIPRATRVAPERSAVRSRLSDAELEAMKQRIFDA